MRKEPSGVPAVVGRKEPSWSESVSIELITRLFGGGATARELDPIAWLRSSAAKSAIRAWWRAGYVDRYATIEALREEEKRLFGAPARYDDRGKLIDGPGLLEVSVTARALAGVPYREPMHSPLNGAYFPALPMGDAPAALGPPSPDAVAHLALSTKAQTIAGGDREAILDGLRLWLTLGGVGSRTRRGAGAIAVSSKEAAASLGIPVSHEELEHFLRKHTQRRKVEAPLDGFFSLARTQAVLVGRECSNGEQAQSALLAAMREARQDRPHPPSWRGRDDWGRSRWPEADAIRLKTKRLAPRGGWRHTPKTENENKYPRAALGLPIVVHFQPPREPEDNHHILGAMSVNGQWTKLDRYASPILLRPVRVWKGDKAVYVPIALFTDCTLQDEIRPLVTTNPKAPRVDAADVVRSFGIRDNADETLQRVEKAFHKAGFKPL